MIQINKNRCYNGGNKHKFQPRYTEVPNDNFTYSNIKGIYPGNLRKLMVIDVYVGDVCVWCGKTTNTNADKLDLPRKQMGKQSDTRTSYRDGCVAG